MTTYVLVHGAFRGGWSWRFVEERLRAAGHLTYSPSLTGMGDRSHLAGPGRGLPVTLDTWVSDVVNVLESRDLTDVVLVAHSQGGLVTTAASEVVSSRLARLVFLDAPVPADGERGVDLNPPGVPAPPDDLDLDLWLPSRPVEVDEGYSPELADWVNARLSPTPVRPSFDRVSLTSPAALAVPRSYVFFSRTPATYPCWSTRLRLVAAGEAFTELEAGHDAPLLAPDDVAALLLDVGAR